METTPDASSSGLIQQLLPFRIIFADTEELLQKACDIRYKCYKKHIPELAEGMQDIAPEDRHPDYAVMLAVSKVDESVIGTVRVQVARSTKLGLERSVSLPAALKNNTVAEITRLTATGSNGSLTVRLMLMKASYWYARLNDVSNIFLCARSPVDKQYQVFKFNELFENKEFYPMSHIGGIAHRVMWFNLMAIEQYWKKIEHPFYHSFVKTFHPDVLEGLHMLCIEKEKYGSSFFKASA